MKYKFVQKDGEAVTVHDDSFEYCINVDNCCISQIKNYLDSEHDGLQNATMLFIPSVFETELPDGSTQVYNVTAIGSGALMGCLCHEVIVSDEIECIESQAFIGSSFFTLTWPKACKLIPYDCFYNSHIMTINGIEEVTCMGEGAFHNSRLRDITFPQGLYKIVRDAFKGCSNLKSVVLPDTVKYVGPNAFSSSGVESVTWSAGCDVIPKCAFQNCQKLERVFGISHVTEICEGAFSSCKMLSEIEWPKNCDKVPKRCFASCHGLKEIKLPDTVTSIGDKAFEKTYIRRFDYPSCCDEVPHFCFSGCMFLKEVSFSGDIRYVGQNAFEGTAIETFDWPSPCKTITANCFHNSNLRVINGIGSVVSIEDSAFSGCRRLESFNWPSKCRTIKPFTFCRCTALNDFHGTEYVNRIDCNAFDGTKFSSKHTLDLSRAPIMELRVNSLAGLKPNSVIPPYYMTAEDLEKAFYGGK